MNVTKIFLLILFQGLHSGIFCQRWTFPIQTKALIGSCVEVPCTYSPGSEDENSSIVWYMMFNTEIFNSKRSSFVTNDFISRTSLVPGGDCTLRIDPVRVKDRGLYYPGVIGSIRKDAFGMYHRRVFIGVTDSPEKPVLSRAEDMKEGKPTIIQCYADHTCASSPPSLEWNKPGVTNKLSIPLFEGYSREVSELTYFPLYMDDMKSIQCTATYHNGLKSQTEDKLNIKYAPAKVRIIQTKVEHGVIELKCDFLSSRPNVTHYSWMKDKSLLPMETGKIILVNKSEENKGNYVCVAHNEVGGSSSAGVYIGDIEQVQMATNFILYLAISGIVGLLLLLIIIYLCWRKKVCHTPPSTESAELHEATYADLVISDVSKPYDTLKTAEHHIYTILVASDVSEPYDTLKREIPVELTVTARNGAAIIEYENIYTNKINKT